MDNVSSVVDYTVIYSQPSVEALESLVNTISRSFGLVFTCEDLFYYGVFCKAQTYAFFEFDKSLHYDFEIPLIITNPLEKNSVKIGYVNDLIDKIMMGDIKPEWMKYVEMNANCNEYGQAPSTFLYIKAKNERYNDLSSSLINFLYSPNLLITMLEK